MNSVYHQLSPRLDRVYNRVRATPTQAMTHNAIQAVKAVVNGYCELHETTPSQCGAAQELGKYTILGLGIYGVWKALSKGHEGYQA